MVRSIAADPFIYVFDFKKDDKSIAHSNHGMLSVKKRPALIMEKLQDHCRLRMMESRSGRGLGSLNLKQLVERIVVQEKSPQEPWDVQDAESNSIFSPLKIRRSKDRRPLSKATIMHFTDVKSAKYSEGMKKQGWISPMELDRVKRMGFVVTQVVKHMNSIYKDRVYLLTCPVSARSPHYSTLTTMLAELRDFAQGLMTNGPSGLATFTTPADHAPITMISSSGNELRDHHTTVLHTQGNVTDDHDPLEDSTVNTGIRQRLAQAARLQPPRAITPSGPTATTSFTRTRSLSEAEAPKTPPRLSRKRVFQADSPVHLTEKGVDASAEYMLEAKENKERAEVQIDGAYHVWQSTIEQGLPKQDREQAKARLEELEAQTDKAHELEQIVREAHRGCVRLHRSAKRQKAKGRPESTILTQQSLFNYFESLGVESTFCGPEPYDKARR